MNTDNLGIQAITAIQTKSQITFTLGRKTFLVINDT